MRALVVEDDANVRRATISIVRRTFPGVDIIAAESADEAIGLLEESACKGPPFDLIVSDYNLLGTRTGGDVLDWIQAHLSYLEKRFVFLASDDAIRLRGVPFFEKPCDINELRVALRQLVDTNH
jgi:CheY-like chemotaxis protein